MNYRMPSPFRPLTAAILFAALGSQAFAARPDTRTMTCAQARGTIAQNGSLVMTTGEHTYTRVVHNRGFCSPSQDVVREIAPTQDDPRCRVGYTCNERLVVGGK